MNKWLDNLKKGDKVIVKNRYIGILFTVDRVTKTQVIVNGIRYSKKNGFLIGEKGWNIIFLDQATTEKINEINRVNARYKNINFLNSFDKSSMTDKQLTDVVSFIKCRCNK